MDLEQILLFALIIMLTYFIEGLIGFGGTIMALPLASMVVPLNTTVHVLTLIVLLASLFIVIKDYKYIERKQFLKISGFMILGLPIGMILFTILPERPLKMALGLFMILVGINGIYKMKNTKKQSNLNNIETSKTKTLIENITLFLGGIVHGAFTCGGPFVVVYATKNIKNKYSFRATLCALWVTLNSLMLIINLFRKEITPQVLTLSGFTMLFVVGAIIISNIVIKKINADSFNKFVYFALCLSGVLMGS
ncbi:MAG: sulfite exporter TauE/SafE family protein [Sarcina sp.]